MNIPYLQRASLFPGQQPDEKIHLCVRPHWITLVYKLILWVTFVAILFIADFLANKYLPILLQQPYVDYYNLAKSVYLMFVVLGLLIVWVVYYLNLNIVTNERVVDITQNSLVHHTIAELHLGRIEDVTAEVKGFLPTFLNYGTVYIQTAGETERFVFADIPNPTYVSKIILDLYEQLPDEKKHKE